MASPVIIPVFHWTNVSGVSSAGYKLFSYFAGTSVPQTTWTDASQVTANANPVVLDAAGDANVWIAGGIYKFVLTLPDGLTVVWSADNVSQAGMATGTQAEYVPTGLIATFVSVTQFTVPNDVRTVLSVKRAVQFNGGGSNLSDYIASSTFGAGTTTVTISGAFGTVPSPITALAVGLFDGNNQGNSPAGMFSAPHLSTINYGASANTNIATNTLYVLGAAATPWAVASAFGDDYAEYSSGTVTVKQAGRYLVTATCNFLINGATVTLPGQMTAYLNNVVQNQTRCVFALGTGGLSMQASISTILFATAGQTIQVKLDNGPTISAGTAQSGPFNVNVIQLW